MSMDHRTELANIKRFDQLIAYLRDEMGWPIARDSFEDVDDLFYDFTADELGIDPKTAAKIESIKRLRPLSPRQPWGIFFIRFEPKRLPVVVLRRILSQVALKKRASANSAERAAWAADDLLFISNYGEGDERQISFAHFSQAEAKQDLPTLKVLGWDNLDTALHLDSVAERLTRNLAWPDDDGNVEAWRKTWRDAFTLRHREVITTSRDLAIRLAELARAIRDRIRTALVIETENGPLTKLMKAFQEALVHDLQADGFADMYAQTIAYGLLSARIADPHKNTADDFASHMRTNPFLRELMETFLKVGGRHGKAGGPGIDFDELGVSEVVELLDDANMEAVVRDFGDRNPQEDPVIHFYEVFLKEYDAKKRMERGVFYTPRPVVSYIVRSVDELLRTEFGLEDGLADTTTWGEMAKRRKNVKIPQDVSPEQDFVQILDPATGTGTFLVEVIDVIHKTLAANWKKQGHSESKREALWNEYVPKHLLPRLHGYELLMAPYAIAHLKIGLKLYETGYRFGSNERVRIYLTNALEPAHDFSGTFEFAIPALAHEAHAVNEIKRKQRFTVVIGNPPYNNSSENKTPWIMGLIEIYKEKVRKEETQIQALSDDYIKFVRLADWNISRTGAGVVGIITNNGYLDGHIFTDLRAHLTSAYSSIRVINLHGDARKKEKTPDGIADKNVFDIMQGVAILILGRRIDHERASDVSYTDLWGDRDSKYRLLGSSRLLSGWILIASAAAAKMFVPALSSLPDWDIALPLAECFGSGKWQADKTYAYGSGFKSQQDDFAMAFTPAELISNVETLLRPSMTEPELRKRFSLCNTNQWSFLRARERLGQMNWKSQIQRVLFRPFDFRFTIITADIVTNPRREIMGQLERPNIALLATRKATEGFAAFVSGVPCGHKIVGNYDMTTVFPAYRYTAAENGLLGRSDNSSSRSNLSPSLVRSLVAATGNNGATAEDFIQYAYAVFYSPGYRSRYAEFLKIDFPRIPLPGCPKLFRDLSGIGAELLALHLMESPKLNDSAGTYRGPVAPEVGRIGWSDNTVWLDGEAKKNEGAAAGFRGVTKSVWNFHIGSYQICERWLKDRKGRTLSKGEILHYEKIVIALSETIRLMKEVDKVIAHHGGWPGAFHGAAISNGSATVADVEGEVREPPPNNLRSITEYTIESASLLEAAEPDPPSYASENAREVGRPLMKVDNLDRDDLICAIRQLFADRKDRSRDEANQDLARTLGSQLNGEYVEERLDNALRTAVRRGVLANTESGLSLSTRSIADYERDFLKEQFLASLPGRNWDDRDDAIRNFARWLGFRRTGPVLDETARSLINGLLRNRRLESDGSSIRRCG
jgi:type I restriction-modification system DNA methylase subunit